MPIMEPTSNADKPKQQSPRLNPDKLAKMETEQVQSLHMHVPNCNRLLEFFFPNVVSQEAINNISHQVFYGTDIGVWTPREFLTASMNALGNNRDIDTEHMRAVVIHP